MGSGGPGVLHFSTKAGAIQSTQNKPKVGNLLCSSRVGSETKRKQRQNRDSHLVQSASKFDKGNDVKMVLVVSFPGYVLKRQTQRGHIADTAKRQGRTFLKQCQLIRHFDSTMICYDIMALLQQTDEAIIPAAKGLRAILQAC